MKLESGGTYPSLAEKTEKGEDSYSGFVQSKKNCGFRGNYAVKLLPDEKQVHPELLCLCWLQVRTRLGKVTFPGDC